MNDPEITPYGGVVGRVLREAFSFATFLSGFCFILIGAAGVLVLGKIGAGDLASPLAQVLLALILARYALNGLSGEWRGSVFSLHGGDWIEVGVIAFRFVLLSFLWLVPLLLLGLRPGEATQSIGMLAFGMAGTKAALLGLIYLTCLVLSPPLLLIASVRAPDMRQLFSPSLWSDLFRGRLGDLFLIYASYLGGLSLVTFLCLPVVGVVMMGSRNLGLVTGGLALAFMAGLAPSLLGRMCGFFAASAGPEESFAWSAGGSPVPGAPAGGEPAGAGEGPSRGTGAPSAVSAGGAGEIGPSGLPYLANPRELVGRARATYEKDPARAIANLLELRDQHETDPMLLHALFQFQRDAGKVEEGLACARQAIEWSLAHGNPRFAGEVYRETGRSASSLGIKAEDAVTMANALRGAHQHEEAADLYREILERDPSETRAVKGLLQIGEAFTFDENKPGKAVAIYDFLLEHCADSPLADFMRDGKVEANRRLESPQTAPAMDR